MRSSKTILVVDDDEVVRHLIEVMLNLAGYRVITAADGEEGVKRIRRDKPDVVITDVNMPRLGGKGLCEMTDALKSERPFLTVVLTANPLEADETWVRGMTETQFMDKPFSPACLLEAVDRYLGETG